ncbi:RNase H family protein [Ferrovum sp.]|uniref:ribonuclease HI n=1 Tax=Ferrovum sp. TaxID=2609467 RepID=UPI002632FF7E|nr:RNase H family protein [Ferrovum sp.]
MTKIHFPVNRHICAYTDGSHNPNTGDSGWGVVFVVDGIDVGRAGGRLFGNINPFRAEIHALVGAIKLTPPRSIVTLCTDSLHVVTVFGKRHFDHAPDLWKEFTNAASGRIVRIEWIKGHADNPYNLEADSIARKVAEG